MMNENYNWKTIIYNTKTLKNSYEIITLFSFYLIYELPATFRSLKCLILTLQDFFKGKDRKFKTSKVITEATAKLTRL